MTEFTTPRTEIEWSRRAIINVVGVLEAHAESLTLIGAHAVLLRTMGLDVRSMPTGDGDLGVTPGLVGNVPSIESLLAQAGYEHRTTARPGLWGKAPYHEPDGTRAYREKIDLLAPNGLSGAKSRTKRGVPALQRTHGKCHRQCPGPGARCLQPLATDDHRLRRFETLDRNLRRRGPSADSCEGLEDR